MTEADVARLRSVVGEFAPQARGSAPLRGQCTRCIGLRHELSSVVTEQSNRSQMTPMFGLSTRRRKAESANLSPETLSKPRQYHRDTAFLQMLHPRQRHALIIAASLILPCAIYLAGCAGTEWQSTYAREHPLTGRIWDVGAAEFIDRQTLIRRLARADFVLLGEQHDNRDHHRLQAGILRSLVAAGRKPAVAFEMFNVDDTPAIQRHLRDAPGDAAGLGEAVNWNGRGWPDWRIYQAIAEAALAARLPIVATNLPDTLLKRMNKDGLNALEPRERSNLGLDRPPDKELLASLTADIRDAHCGYVSDERLESMISVQRARDAYMAQSLLASGVSGAVLIAGAGHVRKDYGIPIYLAASAPEKRVASVGLLEVSNHKNSPGDYASAGGTRVLPFDYVWFTPRSDAQAPCDKFKDQLERLKKPKASPLRATEAASYQTLELRGE